MWYRVGACPAWNSPLVSGNSIIRRQSIWRNFLPGVQDQFILRDGPLLSQPSDQVKLSRRMPSGADVSISLVAWRETPMAKNGLKLIDAEMHVMEPVDLWQRYIDPEFATRAPRRLDERRWDIRTIVEGEVMAQMPGGDWPALTDAEEKALAERYAEEIARNFDPESQVRAMDKEGLDLAILFPTSAMYVTAFTKMDPRFAAAACRAYNDWLHDYIQAADPKRMFGAAAISPHDVDSAVIETRRSVTQLRMKATFLRPNIYNERPWHDPYYDPLWAVCQELNVPVGFHETTGSRMKAAGADRFKNMGIAHISTHSMEQMLACTSSWAASWSASRSYAAPSSRRIAAGCRSGCTAWTSITSGASHLAR